MKTTPFQLVILAVFGFLGLLGVAIFAMTTAGGKSTEIGEVVIWGTFPERQLSGFLHDLGTTEKLLSNAVYVEKSEKTFYQELTDGLASGKGPDLIIMDQPHVEKYKDALIVIPYTELSQRAYMDAFIDATSTLLTDEGMYGIPFAVDPLVMYWNKDIFAQNAIPEAPKYWEEVAQLTEQLTQRDEANNIVRSGIALGETQNVLHAKEIISAMIIQAGGKIIERNAEGDLDSYLGAKDENDLSPAQAALRFYTEFADPSKKRYSWNKSLPNSRDMFAQGDSAMYIGSASEIETLQEKNPNLNFDVAPLPKIRPNENVQIVTTGTIYVLAIPRAAKNPEGANTIAKIISSGAASELLESLLLIPSPQRVLLSPLPNDAIRSSFRAAAVQMRVWPDPDPDASRDILYNMISRVVTGVDRLSESVQRADAEMKILLRDTQ